MALTKGWRIRFVMRVALFKSAETERIQTLSPLPILSTSGIAYRALNSAYGAFRETIRRAFDLPDHICEQALAGRLLDSVA